MRTPRLGPHLPLELVTGIACAVLFSLVAQNLLAQTQQPDNTPPQPPLFRPPYPLTTPVSQYGATGPLELTYTNFAYGISFRFPSDSSFQEWAATHYSVPPESSPHSDLGRIVLANVMIFNLFRTGMVGPSPILTVGVSPKMSEESCASLVAPDQWTSGAAMILVVNGVKFVGRSEVSKSPQFAMQTSYQRQYTAYSNALCYEFDIDWSAIDPSHVRSYNEFSSVPADPNRLLGDMESILRTVQFQPPNLAMTNMGAKSAHVTRPWETSLAFPKELAKLDELADWKIIYPSGAPFISFTGAPSHYKICGEGDWSRYLGISFVSGAGPELDNAAANAAVDKLNADVIQLLRSIGWKLMNSSPGAPDSACYGKDGVYVTTGGKGTDRCTMNSPCTVSDILTVTVFVPSPKGNGAQ